MIQISASGVVDSMSDLKLRLKTILGLFDERSRVIYVDYPVHSNIGDLLINLGTEQFFLDYGIPIKERYSVLDMPALSRLEGREEITFLCHGGGNFGDLYKKHQHAREELIDHFPRARIVFLPQSLHFSSKEAERKSLEKIAAHSNCHVLVRDQESLDALQDSRVTQCSLMPDMAHQLWRELTPAMGRERGRDVYFLRRDKEASSAPAGMTDAFAKSSVDWRDIVSSRHTALAGSVYFLLKNCGRILPPSMNASMWYAMRDSMVEDAVKYFSCHDRVYTNRLHAMILALLLGRDVTAFDNSYGKLSRYIATWLYPALQEPL